MFKKIHNSFQIYFVNYLQYLYYMKPATLEYQKTGLKTIKSVLLLSIRIRMFNEITDSYNIMLIYIY